tara:strand:- start:380 stop:892 length:513 start_codon:yes stop_codon:yes gene_type:complete
MSYKYTDEELLDPERYKEIVFFEELYNTPMSECLLFSGRDIEKFTEEEGYTGYIKNNAAEEKIKECQKDLFQAVRKTDLTQHQEYILTLTLDGETQDEIAKRLCITQSAVHKALSGNIVYEKIDSDTFAPVKRYGGIYKKMHKKSKKNPKIQTILRKIKRIKNSSLEELE